MAHSERSKESIVEQILQQGQKLRNAMVQAIIDADPFYVDETVSKSKKEGKERIGFKYHMHSVCNLCNKSGFSKRRASCSGNVCTCHRCHCRSNNVQRTTKLPCRDVSTLTSNETTPPDDVTKSIQDSYRSKSAFYFKYVNSLKISLHSLKLNQAGNRKVNASSADAKYRVPLGVSHNYFVEYALPEVLDVHPQSGYAKVDSGLNASRFRICSKKFEGEEIHLKHTSIHDTKNLLNLDLKATEILFQVSCRTMRQKNTNIIGYGRFNMSLFEVTKNLTYNQDIPIIDSEGICYGLLKLSLQLGCGRMYFGKEFVDFVSSNIINLESLHFNSSRSASNMPLEIERLAKHDRVTDPVQKPTTKSPSPISSSSKNFQNVVPLNLNFESKTSNNTSPQVTGKQPGDSLSSATNRNYKDLLLFGIIYISEAQYFKKLDNTYLSCEVFCQGDTVHSRIIYNNRQPVFNFYQKIPLLLDDVFLSCLRDNCLRVHFWERCEDEDVVFGETQLPLHQFYTTYKNPVIVQNIINNKLPVIISDWWEPISDISEGDLCGQVKILIALGNATQIENLEIERGIRESSCKVKYIPILSETKSPNKIQVVPRTAGLFRRPNYLKSNKNTLKVNKSNNKKIDVGVQSDLDEMESHGKDNAIAQNILETFLMQLQDQKAKNIHVESATNTEPPVEQNDANKSLSAATESLHNIGKCRNATNMHLQKTSELLDYLNDALSGDSKTFANEASTLIQTDTNSFKAHIVIDSALHLPAKRNYKSRKTKKKYTEGLPSTYVTFETALNEVKVTNVVAKSCSPKWNFACDVSLPIEFLNNNQKRLIFKVWSKNFNSLHPNTQTDIVLGFAALDLTVLLSGLPSVQGWFNIIDFTSKCNGQIKIDVTPLENIKSFSHSHVTTVPAKNQYSSQSDYESEPKELLSRALKRKFTQLDEITQRLRVRLADVTKDDSDLSNDAFADEFERDINTASVEVDHDMIDLSSLDCKSNSSCSSATALEASLKLDSPISNHFISSADRELLQGKQRIDMLLEKLSLLSNNEAAESSFSNRYVSGCSLQQNCDEMLIKQIGIHPALNEIDSIPSLTELSDISSKGVTQANESNASSSSLSTKFPVFRYAPDGAGNSVVDGSGTT